MKKFLENYTKKGLIKKEKIGFDQVIKHIRRASKDLKVARANLNIDAEASYNYAYLAMLRTGRALMLSFGFRPIDGQQHKTVVDFAKNVLGSEFANLVMRFHRMRKKRNQFTYDEPGLLVSKRETQEALNSAKKFVRQVIEFIQKKNPQKSLV